MIGHSRCLNFVSFALDFVQKPPAGRRNFAASKSQIFKMMNHRNRPFIPFKKMKTAALALFFAAFANAAFSQKNDSTKHVLNFRGNISATNNGFSLIPTFSLGKPAVVSLFAINSGKRLSFEPEFRYSMAFKPWSFVFIWRYKLVKKARFHLNLGTHLPSLNFKTAAVEKNGATQTVTQVNRFFPAFEVAPNFKVAKNIHLGVYYLYGRGLEKDIPRHTNFVSAQANFSKIPISGKVHLRLFQQFFYLKSDDRDGFYTAGSLVLAKTGFPISVGAAAVKAFETTIPGKDFNWNVSLIYHFDKKYTRD